MKTQFKSSFKKDLKNVKDKSTFSRVKSVILDIEQANSLHYISNCKKMQGVKDFYRIRIGNYRIGLLVDADTVVFVRFLSRGDIYKYFP